MAAQVRFPSLDGLRAFESAARLGSFERAAEHLSITASAVSKRVATLEDLLGTPLLTRGAKALLLTPTGKEYLAQVSAALGMLAAVPLHQAAAQRTQRLRVTTPPTFARQILVPCLEQFTAAHAEIEIEAVLSIPYIDSGNADSDVEIRFRSIAADAADPGEAPLMVDIVLPLASPGLLARLPPMLAPADLANAPLLRTPLEPWAPWFAAAGLRWSEPTQGPRLVDLGLTLEAAVSGQGVVLARPSLARQWLASRTLVAPFKVTAVPTQQYFLRVHADGSAPKAFAAWLTKAFEQAQLESQALLSRPG